MALRNLLNCEFDVLNTYPSPGAYGTQYTVSGELGGKHLALRTKGRGSLQLDVQFANRPVKGDTGNAKLTGCFGHIVAVGA